MQVLEIITNGHFPPPGETEGQDQTGLLIKIGNLEYLTWDKSPQILYGHGGLGPPDIDFSALSKEHQCAILALRKLWL